MVVINMSSLFFHYFHWEVLCSKFMHLLHCRIYRGLENNPENVSLFPGTLGLFFARICKGYVFGPKNEHLCSRIQGGSPFLFLFLYSTIGVCSDSASAYGCQLSCKWNIWSIISSNLWCPSKVVYSFISISGWSVILVFWGVCILIVGENCISSNWWSLLRTQRFCRFHSPWQ